MIWREQDAHISPSLPLPTYHNHAPDPAIDEFKKLMKSAIATSASSGIRPSSFQMVCLWEARYLRFSPKFSCLILSQKFWIAVKDASTYWNGVVTSPTFSACEMGLSLVSTPS